VNIFLSFILSFKMWTPSFIIRYVPNAISWYGRQLPRHNLQKICRVLPIRKSARWGLWMKLILFIFRRMNHPLNSLCSEHRDFTAGISLAHQQVRSFASPHLSLLFSLTPVLKSISLASEDHCELCIWKIWKEALTAYSVPISPWGKLKVKLSLCLIS
jgi:hypothetical protein